MSLGMNKHGLGKGDLSGQLAWALERLKGGHLFHGDKDEGIMN